MKFEHLLPETIFSSLEEQGYTCTGGLTPLNSYENRVYELGIEGDDPLIVKYYRPKRWTLNQIAEEHRFIEKLDDLEIPVVSALPLKNYLKESHFVSSIDGTYYSIYPKFRGRESSEIRGEDLKWLGRLLARIHNVGEDFHSTDRIVLDENSFGWDNFDKLIKSTYVPLELKNNLEDILSHCLELVSQILDFDFPYIMTHGDCHIANILWNFDGPHLIDFDDCLLAPPIQDLWMLFYGTDEEKNHQKKLFFEGYSVFRDFDMHSFVLTEALRTLRMIRHQAWIGERFEERIFQLAFPYYPENRHFQQFLLDMKEQIALMQEVV